MAIDAAKLKELKLIVSAASQGPWRYHEMSLGLYKNHNQPIAERVAPEDGVFMVAARDAMARLIDEVERLRVELESFRSK